jgi:hypothetical protein
MFLEMGKEPSEYTVAQLKVLSKYKAQPGDSPIKAKKGELVTQWEQRKN